MLAWFYSSYTELVESAFVKQLTACGGIGYSEAKKVRELLSHNDINPVHTPPVDYPDKR